MGRLCRPLRNQTLPPWRACCSIPVSRLSLAVRRVVIDGHRRDSRLGRPDWHQEGDTRPAMSRGSRHCHLRRIRRCRLRRRRHSASSSARSQWPYHQRRRSRADSSWVGVASDRAYRVACTGGDTRVAAGAHLARPSTLRQGLSLSRLNNPELPANAVASDKRNQPTTSDRPNATAVALQRESTL